MIIDRFDDSYLRLGRKTNEQLRRNWESQTSEETQKPRKTLQKEADQHG